LHINIKTFMHKQAIKHKQAIIGGGYLFNSYFCFFVVISKGLEKHKSNIPFLDFNVMSAK